MRKRVSAIARGGQGLAASSPLGAPRVTSYLASFAAIQFVFADQQKSPVPGMRENPITLRAFVSAPFCLEKASKKDLLVAKTHGSCLTRKAHGARREGQTQGNGRKGEWMTAKELEEGMRAFLDEALAVALGKIGEDQMTMPTEFEDLIRVATFEEEGVFSSNPGLVLRFNKGGDVCEFQIGTVRSR